MPNTSVSVFKFVGTISLGLLTGVSFTLNTLTLPSLLSLPTAPTARTTLTYLTTRTRTLQSYLRHITAFSLFSAYLISPRRFRHPYLLYTAIFAAFSGPGIDLGFRLSTGKNESREELDLEAQGEDVNGEEVGQAVERMRTVEGVRAGVAGFAFAMGVLGIWGDGA